MDVAMAVVTVGLGGGHVYREGPLSCNGVFSQGSLGAGRFVSSALSIRSFEFFTRVLFFLLLNFHQVLVFLHSYKFLFHREGERDVAVAAFAEEGADKFRG